MKLVDWQIEKLIMEGLTDPKWIKLIQPSSMDVTLGSKGLKLVRSYQKHDCVDSVGNCFKEYFIGRDGLNVIHPEERWLLETEQFFHIPKNITATFYLKSSRGREFYDHKLAGHIDPGFSGKLTLEIINHSFTPLPLYQGLKIGQLVFDLHGIPVNTYQGKYQGDDCVSISKDKEI